MWPMIGGQRAAAGAACIEKTAMACSTHAHGTTPTHRLFGACRRPSVPSLRMSRSPYQNASETSHDRLIVPSSTPVAHAGIVGSSHAGPRCVSGHAHSPVSPLQLPWRVQPRGHRGGVDGDGGAARAARRRRRGGGGGGGGGAARRSFGRLGARPRVRRLRLVQQPVPRPS